MLIVETGEGLSSAKSLVSVSATDEYFRNKEPEVEETEETEETEQSEADSDSDSDTEGDSGVDSASKTWLTETEQNKKEFALIRASGLLWFFGWRGKKLRKNQGLAFPRKEIVFRSEVLEGVPNSVQEFCMELANQILLLGWSFFENASKEKLKKGSPNLFERGQSDELRSIHLGSLKLEFSGELTGTEKWGRFYESFLLSTVPESTRARVLGYMVSEEMGYQSLSLKR